MRATADRDVLTATNSPLSTVCGAMGRLIAARVIEGNGKAVISASDIKIAIDTSDGTNMILDNFDLFDEQTREPLMFHLLKNA